MLSTPPAFILSQDQTLVKSVCIQFRINILANSSLFTVVWFLTVRSTASSSKLRFSLSWLRQYSQASLSESKLSKLLLCSCSLRFSKIFSQRNFQGLLLSIVQLSRFFLPFFSSDSFCILSKAFLFVKNFFIFLFRLIWHFHVRL